MHKQDGGDDWDRGKEHTGVKKGGIMYASCANVLQFVSD